MHRHRFPARAAARTAIFEFIEVFYNRRRLHSSIGYLSPVEFERGSRRIGRTLQLPSPNASTKAGQDQFGDHSPICEMPSGNGSTGSGKSVG